MNERVQLFRVIKDQLTIGQGQNKGNMVLVAYVTEKVMVKWVMKNTGNEIIFFPK